MYLRGACPTDLDSSLRCGTEHLDPPEYVLNGLNGRFDFDLCRGPLENAMEIFFICTDAADGNTLS